MWKTHAIPERAYGAGLCSDMSLSSWYGSERKIPTALHIAVRRGT